MIRIRSFRNDDPPRLAEIWNSQPPLPGRIPRVTPLVFENYIFSKLYFERHGLRIAERDGEAIGFVHAGFGPNEQGTEIDSRNGVVAALLAKPHPEQADTLAKLYGAAETYLRDRGAVLVTAGGTHSWNPFYLGLLGASQVSGIRESDGAQLDAFRGQGYAEQRRYSIQSVLLASFRPPMDRQMLQWRRQFQVQMVSEPPDPNWWRASVLGISHRNEFILQEPSGAIARMTLWDVEPYASSQNLPMRGVFDWSCDEIHLKSGLMTFFVGEVLRQLTTERVGAVEFPVRAEATDLISSLQRLGFRQIDQGIVLEKKVGE